jgi:hypothetical protein
LLVVWEGKGGGFVLRAVLSLRAADPLVAHSWLQITNRQQAVRQTQLMCVRTRAPPPRALSTFSESQTHPATSRQPNFYPPSLFWAFLLGKGSSKTPRRNFPQKSRQQFRCQFPLDLFALISFSGGSQRREFKGTTKRFCKEIVSKRFYEKSTKKQKKQNRFLSFFLGRKNHIMSRFWALLGAGSSKTPPKHKPGEKKSDPGPFLASDPPAHRGGHRLLLFAGPLARR